MLRFVEFIGSQFEFLGRPVGGAFQQNFAHCIVLGRKLGGQWTVQERQSFLRSGLRDQDLRFKYPEAPAPFLALRSIPRDGVVRIAPCGAEVSLVDLAYDLFVNLLRGRVREATRERDADGSESAKLQ